MQNAKFNLDDYETVETRLAKFWVKFPDGRVSTSMVAKEDGQFIFSCALFRTSEDNKPFATGFAEERVGVGMVNKTSAAENCETSAIGRALANGGFASTAGKRPSREEMQKVQRLTADAPAEALKVAELIPDITTLDELRDFFKTHVALLDEPVGTNTLRELVMARKEIISQDTVTA